MDASISETEALIATGQLSEIEGERKITDLKKQQLETRLADVREALAREQELGRGDGQRAQELVLEERELQADLVKEVQAGAERLADLQKEALEERLDEVRQTIEAAAAERELALAQMQFDGASENDVDRTRLEGVKEQIQAELELERERINELQKLKSASPKQAEENEREIRAAKQKTVELQADLIENQLNLEENARQQIIKGIENQIDLQKQALSDNEAQQKVTLSQLKAYGADALVIEKEQLNNAKERIKAEIELERQKAEELAKLEFRSPEQAEENEKAVREARRKTLELTSSRGDNLVKR